jgi:hypothetical protein
MHMFKVNPALHRSRLSRHCHQIKFCILLSHAPALQTGAEATCASTMLRDYLRFPSPLIAIFSLRQHIVLQLSCETENMLNYLFPCDLHCPSLPPSRVLPAHSTRCSLSLYPRWCVECMCVAVSAASLSLRAMVGEMILLRTRCGYLHAGAEAAFCWIFPKIRAVCV